MKKICQTLEFGIFIIKKAFLGKITVISNPKILKGVLVNDFKEQHHFTL
jgi:hypothetical protein